MKLIIAGSRNFANYYRLKRSVLNFIGTTPLKEVEFISGGATGADRQGEWLARQLGKQPIRMPADWDKYGRRAGHIRNREMAKIATHCIVFWDRVSPGTRDMIECARGDDLKLRICLF